MNIEEMMELVNQNGFSIRNIENPPKEVAIKAIRQNPYAIKFIKNADDELFLFAINLEPDVIKFVPQKPEFCKRAVDLCGASIRHINNPTFELCEYTLRKYPGASLYISEDIRDDIFVKWRKEGVC